MDYSKWKDVQADDDLTVAEENEGTCVHRVPEPEPITASGMIINIAAACAAGVEEDATLGADLLRWLVRVGNTRPDFLEGFVAYGADEAPADGAAAPWIAFFDCYSCGNSEVWGCKRPIAEGDSHESEALEVKTRRLTELLCEPLTCFLALQKAWGVDGLERRVAATHAPVRVRAIGSGPARPDEGWILLQQLLGGKAGPKLHVTVDGGERTGGPPKVFGRPGRSADYGERTTLFGGGGASYDGAPCDLVFVASGDVDAARPILATAKDARAPCCVCVEDATLFPAASDALAPSFLDAPRFRGRNPFASLFLTDKGFGEPLSRCNHVFVGTNGPPPPPPPAARRAEAAKVPAAPAEATVKPPWPLRETRDAIKRSKPGCAEYSCGKPNATKACGKCKVTFYCSASCQRKAWAYHKACCQGPNPLSIAKLCAQLPQKLPPRFEAAAFYDAVRVEPIPEAERRRGVGRLLDSIQGIPTFVPPIKDDPNAPLDVDAEAACCKTFRWRNGSDSEPLKGYRDGGEFYYRIFFHKTYSEDQGAPKNPVAVALHCDPNATGSFVLVKLDAQDAQVPISVLEVAHLVCERFAAGANRAVTDRCFAQHMRDSELDFIREAYAASRAY